MEGAPTAAFDPKRSLEALLSGRGYILLALRYNVLVTVFLLL